MAWLSWLVFVPLGLGRPAAAPPPGADPREPPVVDGCTVTVVGLPVPARAHHSLDVSGARTRLSATGLQVDLLHLEIVVRLVGPHYHGELTLHPRAWTGGSVHVLRAWPRPAVLVIDGPKPLAVRCHQGGDLLATQWWLASDLPPIDVGHGRTLRCESKSPGFRPVAMRVPMLPGDNAVVLELEPLGG